MISPHIVVIPRVKKTLPLNRRSFRDISRAYFGAEAFWLFVVELVIFIVLAGTAIWLILDAAALIKAYLL